MRTLCALIAGMVLSAHCFGADFPEPPVAVLWSSVDLEALDKILISKMGETHTANMQVIKGGTYGALVMHREVTGDPELHVKLNDFFVFLSGEGEIEVGGTVTGEKTIKPDEKQGKTLDGGTVYKVKRGDVLFVPANTWHQTMVPKGKELSAFVIKAR